MSRREVAKLLQRLISVALCCLACGAVEPPTYPGVEEIPTPPYNAHDSIDALDFVVDHNGFIHLVWSAGARNKPSPTPAIWYQRGDPKKRTWTRAVQLVSGSSPPRIVANGTALHILFGRRLRHLESRNAGSTWEERRPVLADSSILTAAGAFDAGVHGGGLLVAYATMARKVPGTSGFGPVSVWVRRLTHGGWSQAVQLPTPALRVAAKVPSPRLIAWGDSTYLVYGCNEEILREEPTVGGTSVRAIYEGRISLSRSGDGGASWSAPLPVPLDEGLGRFPVSVWEIEAAKLKDRLLVFFSTPILLGKALGSNGAWSDLSVIAPFDGPQGNSALSPSAAAIGDEGQLIWIDDRLRKRDPGLFTELSAQAYWADNDVFAAPLSGLLQSAAADSHLVPIRLTRDLQYARAVRARSAGGRVYVIWTGRAKVGKNMRTEGAPPVLFMAALPTR